MRQRVYQYESLDLERTCLSIQENGPPDLLLVWTPGSLPTGIAHLNYKAKMVTANIGAKGRLQITSAQDPDAESEFVRIFEKYALSKEGNPVSVGKLVKDQQAVEPGSAGRDFYQVTGENRVVNTERYYEVQAEKPLQVDEAFETALAGMSPSYTFNPKLPKSTRVVQAFQRDLEMCRRTGHVPDPNQPWRCQRCGSQP